MPKDKNFDYEAFDKLILEQIKNGAGIGHDTVKELMARTYQALLDAEMEEHLGYSKGEESENKNSRNGRGKKKIRGDFGEVEISTPRDREGSFDPQIVKKRSSAVGDFTDKVLSLFARGMTTREISAHLQEMYGIELSEGFVSRAVKSIQEEVEDWQSRPLEPLYAILYVDGIRFSVRDNGKVVKKCFYTVLGVSVEGQQDVLGMWLAENEGASFWLQVLKDLQVRGVEDILIACADGLKGMPEAFEATFPEADIQLCIVHQIRNCTKFVSHKDRKELCADMKQIYEAPNEPAAKAALDALREKWNSKYPAVIKSWESKWDLLTNFLKYPKELRKITYTTNSIESLHARFRKNTKNRKVFPNDDSLFRLLYLNIKNMSKKWTKRRGWNTILNQFSILFGDRINKYIIEQQEI